MTGALVRRKDCPRYSEWIVRGRLRAMVAAYLAALRETP